MTYHLRPMDSSEMAWRDEIKTQKRICLVLQGPVFKKNNFTLETIRLYRKLFGGSQIILSTWEDESPACLRPIRDLGIEILLNKKPDYAGESNINLQIVSSRNAVKRAQEIGESYVMKTRTDQRIYAPGVADYLYHLTELFPVARQCRQKKRIAGTSLNTFKYRMYGLSDMLIYGHIDDMLLYWDAELDQRVFTDVERKEFHSSQEKFSRMRVCEVYLVTEFLKKIGQDTLWTLEDSWKTFAGHFCVVDKESLDLFWPKYNRLEYPRVTYRRGDWSVQEMTFRDWVQIYSDLKNMAVPEEMIH